MEGMTLAEAAAVMDGALVGAIDPAICPTGGCIDTRVLNAGELFFALEGEREDGNRDGHRFVDDALNKGAAAAVVSRQWAEDRKSRRRPGTLIAVEAPGLALGALGSAYRRRFRIPVVGITGSSGKTTTKDMAAAVLRTRYRVLSTEGNLNNWLGVPLTILRLSDDDEAAVIELGISEHGGLKYLCQIADPTIGVITNIGPAHLEFLGSVEGVAKAKGELLDHLEESSMAILNLDNLYVSKERARLKGRLLGFGIEKICQFRGEGLVIDQEGCGQFSLQGRFFHLAVPGRHQVYNALAAVAVGAALDVPVEHAARALGEFRPSKLRGQVVERNGIRLLNDSYNANPASMRAALETLAQMSVTGDGRRVAVLGDMLELGTSAVQSHRRLGLLAAGLEIDAVFAFGELSAYVSDGGVSGGLSPKRSQAFKDRDTLVARLRAFLKPGDLVLMKGSRGLAMETTAEALGFETNPSDMAD